LLGLLARRKLTLAGSHAEVVDMPAYHLALLIAKRAEEEIVAARDDQATWASCQRHVHHGGLVEQRAVAPFRSLQVAEQQTVRPDKACLNDGQVKKVHGHDLQQVADKVEQVVYADVQCE